MLKLKYGLFTTLMFFFSYPSTYAAEPPKLTWFNKVASYQIMEGTAQNNSAHTIVFTFVDADNKEFSYNIYIGNSVPPPPNAGTDIIEQRYRLHHKMYDTLKTAYLTGQKIAIAADDKRWITNVKVK